MLYQIFRVKNGRRKIIGFVEDLHQARYVCFKLGNYGTYYYEHVTTYHPDDIVHEESLVRRRELLQEDKEGGSAREGENERYGDVED